MCMRAVNLNEGRFYKDGNVIFSLHDHVISSVTQKHKKENLSI